MPGAPPGRTPRPQVRVRLEPEQATHDKDRPRLLLPHVPAKLLTDAPDIQSVAARERRELDRRELYVEMTRARDGLWVRALGRA
jgi:ATP-dependent exoDNAse (exonuclease V) beta subunit